MSRYPRPHSSAFRSIFAKYEAAQDHMFPSRIYISAIEAPRSFSVTVTKVTQSTEKVCVAASYRAEYAASSRQPRR